MLTRRRATLLLVALTLAALAWALSPIGEPAQPLPPGWCLPYPDTFKPKAIRQFPVCPVQTPRP